MPQEQIPIVPHSDIVTFSTTSHRPPWRHHFDVSCSFPNRRHSNETGDLTSLYRWRGLSGDRIHPFVSHPAASSDQGSLWSPVSMTYWRHICGNVYGWENRKFANITHWLKPHFEITLRYLKRILILFIFWSTGAGLNMHNCQPACYFVSILQVGYLALGEEHERIMFENRGALRHTWTQADGWRKLQNKELHDSYCSPITFKADKSRAMRWTGHIKLQTYALLYKHFISITKVIPPPPNPVTLQPDSGSWTPITGFRNHADWTNHNR